MVDFLLDSINTLSLGSELDALVLQNLSALDDLGLDIGGSLCGFELTEGCLLVDSWTSLSIRILLLSHSRQHGVLFLLLNQLILCLDFLLPVLHGRDFGFLLLADLNLGHRLRFTNSNAQAKFTLILKVTDTALQHSVPSLHFSLSRMHFFAIDSLVHHLHLGTLLLEFHE